MRRVVRMEICVSLSWRNLSVTSFLFSFSQSPSECRAGFSSLGDLRGLQQNDDLMACATGTGASCCRGVNSYLGEGSALYGCGCQPGLLREVSFRSSSSPTKPIPNEGNFSS